MPVKCYGNQIHSSARAENNGNQSSITFESFQECLCDVAVMCSLGLKHLKGHLIVM